MTRDLSVARHTSRQHALPPALRRPIWFVAAGGAAVVAALGGWFAGSRHGTRFDRWAHEELPDAKQPGDARPFALAVDWVGEPVGRTLTVLTLTLVCMSLHRRRLAALAFFGSLLATVAALLPKDPVGRTIHDGSLSYPSGHTAITTALGFVLGLLIADLLAPGRRTAVTVVLGTAGLFGMAGGLAQTSLDSHYATDTIAGLLLGLAVMPFTAWLIDTIADHRSAGPEGEH